MYTEDAKKGMKIRISMGSCEDTKMFCTMTSGMKMLRGTEAIITDICSDGMIQLDHAWTWHPHDMMPAKNKKIVEKEVKEVIEFFDENKVWI